MENGAERRKAREGMREEERNRDAIVEQESEVEKESGIYEISEHLYLS